MPVPPIPGLVCALALGDGRVAATPESPQVPDGFVVELVLHHPDVKWPSAVHCLEDGSLLVAEDPMDMPGPTDQPLDRIWLLRFAPDGTFTKTQFAEKLYAVMGMQEIDDAVYVMNMPFLTVLRDRNGDGVAEERTELISNLGPPAPGWPGGFNDHIVSGIRLGMDGFLYVSVGDKGIPLATGRDGSRITLRGGGVVRLRPDGTELEVVATGTRNHLDVAVDEHDHLFTYDNTDDGLGWWTRLTHIMPTGYYGYPWDYHDRPELMLPCMKDDGGGSPVGGLVYREDAWPEEYRGDLFYCEWADRVVRRFKVERDGASYRCTKTEDFVTPGASGEFRPLDIAESPDGRYLYIADWNHPGWTSPQVAGRVWRVRRADDRPGARPFGALADSTFASLARASEEDLVANLAHPSFRVRLAGQRELARRARAARAADELHRRLGERVRETGRLRAADPASERTMRHLVWAAVQSLVELPRPLAADLLSCPSADVRAQTARALPRPLAREKPIMKILVDRMQHDPDLMVRREAVLALARTGDPILYWPFIRAFDANEDRFVRFALRQGMRAMPCRWDLVLERVLPHSEPRVREEIWLALREIHDADLARALVKAASDAIYTPPMRVRALEELARLHRQRPPWDGKWWSIQPAKSGWPAKTVAWEGTEIVLDGIRRAFESKTPEVRAAALEAVRTTREAELFPCVRARLDAATGDDERGALIALLAEVGDAEAAPRIEHALDATAPSVRCAAVAALHRLQGEKALPALERALADGDPAVRAAALDVFARHPDARRLTDYLGGLRGGGATGERCRQAIASLRAQVRGEVEALAERGELDATTLAVLREIYDEPLPLLRWKLLGPLDRPVRIAAIERATGAELESELDRGHAPGERGLVAASRWVDGAAPHGFVDLKAALPGPDGVAAYAFARLESPLARTARCLVGSDDGVTVWVNGVKVHENLVDRGWTPDQDRLSIELTAGANSILLRVEQAGGDWSFNVKVSDVPAGPLFGAAADRGFDLQKWRDHALSNPGDAARGRTLFYAEQGPGCFRCHAVAGVGPALGPDLRDVGAKYPRADLVASILEPSQRIQDGYAATHVFLDNDDVLSGLVVSEKDGVLRLADASGSVREIPLAEVKARRASRVSAMPAGLAEKFDAQDLADLVAWLETLRQ